MTFSPKNFWPKAITFQYKIERYIVDFGYWFKDELLIVGYLLDDTLVIVDYWIVWISK